MAHKGPAVCHRDGKKNGKGKKNGNGKKGNGKNGNGKNGDAKKAKKGTSTGGGKNGNGKNGNGKNRKNNRDGKKSNPQKRKNSNGKKNAATENYGAQSSSARTSLRLPGFRAHQPHELPWTALMKTTVLYYLVLVANLLGLVLVSYTTAVLAGYTYHGLISQNISEIPWNELPLVVGTALSSSIVAVLAQTSIARAKTPRDNDDSSKHELE